MRRLYIYDKRTKTLRSRPLPKLFILNDSLKSKSMAFQFNRNINEMCCKPVFIYGPTGPQSSKIVFLYYEYSKCSVQPVYFIIVRPGPGVFYIINVKHKETGCILRQKQLIKSPYQIRSSIKSDFCDGPHIKSI